MTTTNGNYWKPRKLEILTCPSGQTVQWKRPGPEFTVKFGRIARTFTTSVQEKPRLEGETEDEYNERMLDEMTDEQAEASLVYLKHLLVASCLSPKLFLNPKEGQLGPEDLPEADFWFLVNHHTTGQKTQIGDTEVEATDLETFRDESGVSGSGVDGTHLPPASEQPGGVQGPISGAGV